MERRTTLSTRAGKFTRTAVYAVIALLLLATAVAWHWYLRAGGEEAVTSLRDGERYVFVSAAGSREVSVIDGKLSRVVSRLTMPAVPRQLLVSDPTGLLAMSAIGSRGLDLVELLPATGRAQIDLGIEADSIALSPDGYLVVAHNEADGTLVLASLQTRKRLFRLDGFGGKHHLTFSYDGSQIYIVDASTAELAVLDLVQQRIIDRINLVVTSRAAKSSLLASALTRTPDGRHGFVAVAGSDKVVVVDLGAMKAVREIRVGTRPSRPYATADARVVLVSNDGDRTVSVIDSTTLQVVATLPGAADVVAINTGWFETFAFVMSGTENRIVVLNLEKFTKVADIELPSPAVAGMVNGVGAKLFAALKAGGRVAVVDTQRHVVQALVAEVGELPSAVAMARSNNYCH